MEERFEQIFRFPPDHEKKMENTMYLEDLTGLLAKVANRIDDESSYYFENEYYMEADQGISNSSYETQGISNSSYETFIDNLKKSFDYGSSKKINIILGKAGIGKSLFFEKGIQRLIKINTGGENEYISMSVDFKNIDNNKDVCFYQKWIYDMLKNNAIDCIHTLGNNHYNIYKRMAEEFGQDDGTDFEKLFPLAFFCEKISNKYLKPCIIVFDNIDLASVKTQKNVFAAIVNICTKFSKFMRTRHSEDIYRVYFVMRPETQLIYCDYEGQLGQIIDFPLPNILKISLSIIKKVLFETAEEFDSVKELPCNITCKDVIKGSNEAKTFQTFNDVATYFYDILDYYLQNIWQKESHVYERLGASVEFHNNIVNYNLRTFIRFLSDTISNGGFKPFTKEFNQLEGGHYGIYDYIQMIIQGKWVVHPGNHNINGEGGNKAPIIFNLFDTTLYRKNQDVKTKHFMLNIRILQYFCLYANGGTVRYGDMEQALSCFFDSNYIMSATKRLVYVYFIYSHDEGDNTIASKRCFEDIVIEDNTRLTLSSTGMFYLEKMIYEFEYIYQMSLSSLMNNQYIDDLKSVWKTKKELVVLCFLKSIFQIIKKNITGYDEQQLSQLKNLFYCIDDDRGVGPFRKMLSSFISVMNNKVRSCYRRQDTNNLHNLEQIKREAENLQKTVANYFKVTFEG